MLNALFNTPLWRSLQEHTRGNALYLRDDSIFSKALVNMMNLFVDESYWLGPLWKRGTARFERINEC